MQPVYGRRAAPALEAAIVARAPLQNRNIGPLAAAQALLFTNKITLAALNGLVGDQLAADKSFATLPVSTQVMGSALFAMPASQLMQRNGRRGGFLVGTVAGLIGGAMVTLGAYLGGKMLLCLGTFVLGIYGAFGQFYRFAAADTASHDNKANAISLVDADGLVGGIVGSSLSKWTRHLAPTEFLASYASLMVFCLFTAVLLSLLRMPTTASSAIAAPPRPLREIAWQPTIYRCNRFQRIGLRHHEFADDRNPTGDGNLRASV